MSLPDPSRSAAVLIGVHDHADPAIPSYPAVGASAERLAELCRDPRLLGLPAERCTTLTGADATKQAVEEAVEAAAAEAEDVLLVYYGGHGLRIASEQKLLLSTSGSRVAPRQRWLGFSALKEMIDPAATRAKRVVVILDCCYSGQAKTTGLRENTDPVTGDRMSVLWTATGATERGWIEDGGRYTNFAGALIAAVESGIDNGPETLSPASIHERLSTAWTHDRQCPDLLTTGNPTLPLFRNLNGRPSRPRTERPRQLIDEPEPLVGRDSTLQRILDYVEARAAIERVPAVCGLQGTPGMGKSSLARQVAAELTRDFGDSQYLIDLQGWNPKLPPLTESEVIERLVRDMAGHQVYPPDDPGRLSQWRQWMLERSSVLVFDNAADWAVVEHCMPPRGARCVVLVTSRMDLTDAVGAEAAFFVRGLDDAGAAALLAEKSHRELDPGAVAALLERFGRSPQTLATVGSVLRGGMDPERFITALDAGAAAASSHHPEASAKEAFQASVRTFDAEEQKVMWAAGKHPGPNFSPASINSMTGGVTTVSEEVTELVLRRLCAEYFLLEPVGPDRFAFHDRYGEYAAELADSIHPGRGDAMLRRLFRGLLARLRGAKRQFTGMEIEQGAPEATRRTPAVHRFADAAAARAWLDESADELEAAAAAAMRSNWDNAAQLVKYLSWWLLFDSRPNRARLLLDRLAESDRLADQAEAWRGLGLVELQSDDFEAASHRFGDARRDFRDLGDAIGEADALIGVGQALFGRSSTAAAARCFDEAESLHRAQGNRRGQADAWRALARVAWLRDQYDTAADLYREAAAAYGDIHDRLGLTAAQMGLGDVARHRADFATAERHYRGSMQVYEELDDRRGQAQTWQALGDNARLSDDYPGAGRYYAKAEQLNGGLGDRLGQADAWWGLGTVAQMDEDYSRAEHHFRSAQSVYTGLGNLRGRADTSWSLGHVARLRGDLETAEREFTAALEAYQAFENLIGQADSWLGLGDTAQARGDLDAAERRYREAETAHRRMGTPRGWANAWRGLGETARLRGDSDTAERYLGDADRTYADTGNLLGRAECHRARSLIAEAKGERGEALRLLRLAQDFYRQAGAERRAEECGPRLDELEP
ncbi:tetratricopeptide repeat protein [Glycomyces sp. TRM65418]|uniref:caspase, EACC1-associated type n=1 Tax=Glycomyces sp. TRM65418 TaxID=2867006 RepID=UPI001CE5CF03|nr:tetratricopeptide repeat protein [Glycomyces sp. TRM65418]MCC3764202.1 tetratricopeptide repeat protein [Glycomyces sp. TRM65418]QZD53886.1 tetratricopeptide repeat protein [Glycomyces sp. TRM65418]